MSTTTAPFTFEPAKKDQAKARIALAGPSGSGKTFTALLMATAFGGRIAVIDTEHGSASKYAAPPSRRGNPRPGEFVFDQNTMTRYDPRDLPRTLAAAAAGGYDTVIIDSLSKFWQGAGGMLEFVDNSTKRSQSGNAFTSGWREARPVENDMIEAMLAYPGHVIVTMRTKTAYEVIDNGRGQKVPTKIGLQPVQREGIEYEFDIVGDMDLENTLTVSKSRCSALSGEVIRRPGAEFAEAVLNWLTDGEPVLTAEECRGQALAQDATHKGLQDLYLRARDVGLLGVGVADDDGNAMTLGQLIISKGKEAEARELFGVQADAAALDAEASAGPEPGAEAEDPPGDPDEIGQQPNAQQNGRQRPKAGSGDDEAWVEDFNHRLAGTPVGGLTALQREIGAALRDKRVTPQTAGRLLQAIQAARRAGQGGAAE